MSDTGFAVADSSRLAVPYADGSPAPERMGSVQEVKMPYGPGSIRFEPARAFEPSSFPSGGCGMVGTADDFMKFLEALRTGESTRAMTANQTGRLGPRPGFAFGFGLSVLIDPEAAQTPQSAGTFAWGGVYGHSWFVDPIKDLCVLVLTNTSVEGMSRFAMQVRDAVYLCL
jgi:CubicO group peptidase (beta-lactamase class C family)